MRHRYLVCYDVANAKRLRQIHKKMLGFGDPIQYSVFKCDLSAAEHALMRGTIQDVINARDDRIMIIRIGPVDDSSSKAVEFMGKPLAPWERQRAIVV